MLTAESRELVDGYWGALVQRMARTHKLKPWEIFSPKVKGGKVAAVRRAIVQDLAEHLWMHVVRYRGRVPMCEVVECPGAAPHPSTGLQPLSTTLIAELFGMDHSSIVLILGRKPEVENSQGECQGVAPAEGEVVK